MIAARGDKSKKKAWQKVTIGNVTVRIYRRKKGADKRYTAFEVADYSKGVRHLRSFSDSEEARKEAERIARKISSGEGEAARMSGKDAAIFGHATELLRPLGVSLLSAVSSYVEMYKILDGDRMMEAAKDFARRNPVKREPKTVRQVADELIALKEKRGGSDRYIEDLRNRLDTFSKAFALDVVTVTTADIQNWLDKLKAKPRTVKNFRDTANTLFKYAEAHGYIARAENPVMATQKPDVRNADPISIYSPAELQRILAAAPESFRPVIALQAFAGLRSAEVLRLNWEDVKFNRGHIELGATKTKTATRRLVPIVLNLGQWLTDYQNKSGKVFRHSRAYFHEVQRNIAVGTEIKADPAKKVAAVKPLEWKHNALRHSFISYRVADVADVPKVALESGNSPAMIFSHYRELVTPADAKAWFAIVPEKNRGGK